MIFIQLHSGLGNQLFQYAFGKLLEKHRKFKVVFFVLEDLDFKLNDFQDIDILKTHGFYKLVFKFILKYNFRTLKFHSCLSSVNLNDISNFHIVSGYFQNSMLYKDNREYLLNLFKVKAEIQDYFISKIRMYDLNDYLVIHYRLNDYKTTVFSEINSVALLPPIWFKKISQRYDLVSLKKIIVSDSPAEAVDLLGLNNNCPVFLNEGPIFDFMLLMFSKNLIISNSSFSWWGAFLNSNPDKKVFAPYNWVGYNVGIEYPKGIMIEEFNWIK